MEQVLSVVEEVFELSGRGCVIAPGIPVDTSHIVKVRYTIRLARPDGSSVVTYIAGIELIGATPLKRQSIPILMPPELRKSDIPIGTKIMLGPRAV